MERLVVVQAACLFEMKHGSRDTLNYANHSIISKKEVRGLCYEERLPPMSKEKSKGEFVEDGDEYNKLTAATSVTGKSPVDDVPPNPGSSASMRFHPASLKRR